MLATTTAMMLPITTSLGQEVPVYLRDRGPGIATSMFGTYAQKGELLIYPFYEYYHDRNFEYEPFDFGLSSIEEFRGRYRAHEGLLFLGYGVSDRLALEIEAGVISATFDKSPADRSALPPRIVKSGLNDVEGQVRWRWNKETATTAEYFTYFETVFPTGEKNSLIGTSDWQFKLGTGRVKGYTWGTMTARVGVEYDAGSKGWGLGEMAVEYLKRVSNRFRLFAMVEGTEDEISLVPEVQWHFSRNGYVKAGSGFGLTSKATDLSPEVGIMFTLNR